MVNTTISNTSYDGYRNVIGLPRFGGSYLPTGRQAARKAKKEVTSIIADNQSLKYRNQNAMFP
jgi:hypothetical protein